MLKHLGEISAISDSLNLQDDNPTILFGPHVDDSSDEYVPLFYISQNIHDAILHNAMLDSKASHNLMPRKITEKLGLEVTRHYKDIFLFDSSKVKFLGFMRRTLVCCEFTFSAVAPFTHKFTLAQRKIRAPITPYSHTLLCLRLP